MGSHNPLLLAKNLNLFRDNPEKILTANGEKIIMLLRMLLQSWRYNIKRKLFTIITIFLLLA